jgi:hypothetical protein
MTRDANGEGIAYLLEEKVFCHPCVREHLGWCRGHSQPALGCCASWTLVDDAAKSAVRGRAGHARCSGCRRDFPVGVVRQLALAAPDASAEGKPPRRRFRRVRRSDSSPRPEMG